MTNNFFASNLKYLRQRNNIEQLELAERLGRKSPSSISEWEKGRYTPKAGVLSDIAKIFNVPLSKLMNEDITKSSITTLDKISHVSSELHPHRQEKVLDFAQAELTDQNKENTIKLFPYNVQEKLSAGTGYGYFDDGNYDTVYYNEQYDYDFASWIFGDSMLPDYPNGDVALIKACPFEYDGCVYAVDWDGQSYIKKVYKEENGLRLVSTNEKYSDKFAPFSEEPRIIGKVVASFTPLEK